MKNIILSISTAILLSACATGPQLYKEEVRLFDPKAEVQYEPALNLEVSAEIGDTLISRSYIKKLPAIRIKKSIKHSSPHLKSTWSIPEGVLVKYAEGQSGVYYSSSEGKFYSSNYLVEKMKVGLVLKDDNSISTNRIYRVYGKTKYHFTDNLEDSIEI